MDKIKSTILPVLITLAIVGGGFLGLKYMNPNCGCSPCACTDCKCR